MMPYDAAMPTGGPTGGTEAAPPAGGMPPGALQALLAMLSGQEGPEGLPMPPAAAPGGGMPPQGGGDLLSLLTSLIGGGGGAASPGGMGGMAGMC